MIPLSRPPYTGNEDHHVLAAMQGDRLSGDGQYSRMCQAWFEAKLGCSRALLTPSCTHALEMAAILLGIRPGDEVIMPSYTFVSTANAFVLHGARIVFVDIRADTMNIDETLIESAITPRTKAIVPVHYAGVSCEMDVIMEIAKRHDLPVIEDAAQGMMGEYKGKPLGTMGQMGAYSFHDTKNYTSGGEGGLLLINDDELVDRAEIVREKGTNRNKFFQGMVDKYTWVGIGSSYLLSELQAAYLWGQLEKADEINQDRLATWYNYYESFAPLVSAGWVQLPSIPEGCVHNAHLFSLRLGSEDERTSLMSHLRVNGIFSTFHYVPLHSAPGGLAFGRFHGDDVHTTAESARLLRLPLWYGMSRDEQAAVISGVLMFFGLKA